MAAALWRELWPQRDLRHLPELSCRLWLPRSRRGHRITPITHSPGVPDPPWQHPDLCLHAHLWPLHTLGPEHRAGHDVLGGSQPREPWRCSSRSSMSHWPWQTQQHSSIKPWSIKDHTWPASRPWCCPEMFVLPLHVLSGHGTNPIPKIENPPLTTHIPTDLLVSEMLQKLFWHNNFVSKNYQSRMG